MRAGRLAALAALVAGVALVVIVFFGGGGGHSYDVVFETGGQLVNGNQVLIGGQPIGTIDGISLTDNGQADVKVTVDEPLHEGTTAVVRSTSLSGIANRYVSIFPGPTNAPTLADGGTITADKTTAPVDLDQLFDTFNTRTRKSLDDFIQGTATVYTGNNQEARQSYKFFGPALQSTDRLLRELTRDQQTFSEFLVSSSRALGAVAQKRDQLSQLTSNTNQALGAIAQENSSLDRSLVALPPAMRQANTTFVNLRSALDDLDPLVQTSLRATRDLPQFLRNLRPVAEEAIPVVGDLRTAVNKPGAHNDLTDALRELPTVQKRAKKASKSGIKALNNTQDEVTFARPYTPDLLGFLTKFSQVTAFYDANGHYARVLPVANGTFLYNSGTSELDPIYNQPSQEFDFYNSTANARALAPDWFTRCPGAATQPAPDGSNPFVTPPLADGLPAAQCDPNDVPMGP